jgi:hypothetical protein
MLEDITKRGRSWQYNEKGYEKKGEFGNFLAFSLYINKSDVGRKKKK